MLHVASTSMLHAASTSIFKYQHPVSGPQPEGELTGQSTLQHFQKHVWLLGTTCVVVGYNNIS